jgi:hypothetical protein
MARGDSCTKGASARFLLAADDLSFFSSLFARHRVLSGYIAYFWPAELICGPEQPKIATKSYIFRHET